MHVCNAPSRRALRLNPLAACLSLALSLGVSTAMLPESVMASMPDAGNRVADGALLASPRGATSDRQAALDKMIQHFAPPTVLGTVIDVTNCNDAGPGSLRQAVANAVTDDTIDLSTLTCSTISLTTGAISTPLNALTIKGPGAGALTIDGRSAGRVIHHTGNESIALEGLTLTGGKYADAANLRGGCVYSASSVALVDSVVTGCNLWGGAGAGVARGGAVYARGALLAKYSTISDSMVYSQNSRAYGGGAFAKDGLISKYSTFDDNTASSQNNDGIGGGVFVSGGGATIGGSTISNNSASRGGGLWIQGGASSPTVSIGNSTISGNVASESTGGAGIGPPLELSSSTIAFNTAANSDCFSAENICAAGVLFAQTANFQSSIIANNKAGEALSDVSKYDTSSGTAGSANNLVTSANVLLPGDTITGDPRLNPLANNGGLTQTHALKADSPAIDAGNNAIGRNYDQRRAPYARVVGAAADIGAFERQGDVIFRNGFEGP